MQTVLQSFVILVGSVILALAGMALLRRYVDLSALQKHRESAGFVYATIGVIYAVLLAFVCIATWEQYTQASSVAQREADTVASLYQISGAFSSPAREQVQAGIERYTQVVIDDEWHRMAVREHSPAAEQALSDLWRTYEQLSPQEQALPGYSLSLNQMTLLQGDRGERLEAAKGPIPRVVWVVLIAGGIITVAFTYLFAVEGIVAQSVMTIALTVTVTGVLVLTFVLDDPFRGDVRVTPDSLRAAQELFVTR